MLALLVQPACEGLQVTGFHEHGAIATASPIASEIGRQILEQGGNAFDVAVAVGFALAVVHPEAGNLGGGGFAVVRDGATGEITALDFREKAPLAATPAMFLDSTGEVIEKLSTHGVLAAGVPGSVAGLHALWERFGTMPWADLVTIAAHLADTGFVVDAYLSQSLEEHKRDLMLDTTTREIFLPNGVAPKSGDEFRQTDLAGSLYALAAEGPEAFYEGVIADQIVATMAEHGGLITKEDLAAYSVEWREPVHVTFDSLDIYSMPPSSSGGVLVGQILKLLEPFDLSPYTAGDAKYIHLFCEAARLAYADRAEHFGDPAWWDVPEHGLLDDRYLMQRRQQIDPDHANNSNNITAGHPQVFESNQTTHYSICDARGNMVAVTTTLNAAYGCMVTVDGAGFLLNNEMDDFAIKPGFPNRYGLVGSEANQIEPGKRMLSSMSPTLVLKRDKPVMVLGSPGGSKIVTTVAQAIIAFSRFGLSPEEIVSQPRFHHQWLPDELVLEKGGFDVGTMQALIRLGHQIKEDKPFGDLQMIYIQPSGLMSGASDPRGGGMPSGL